MHSDKPLVSVIMPVYNTEKYVAEAIESILNQTYLNVELLICDDGSKDKSYEICANYCDKRIRVWRNDKNLGNQFTCNFLFEQASGEFITIQDSDDFSDPHRIEKQVNFLISNPKIGLVGTNAEVLNENKEHLKYYAYPQDNIELKKLLDNGAKPPFSAATVMIRKKVYNQVGGYRLYFNKIGAADYDWIYRVSEKHQVANLPESLYYIRKHRSSFTKSFSSNPLRHISPEIAFFLHNQRRQLGYDDLLTGSHSALNTFINGKIKKYKDPSVLYFEYAGTLFWEGKTIKAYKYLLIALLKRPNRAAYLKTFAYYVKRNLTQ